MRSIAFALALLCPADVRAAAATTTAASRTTTTAAPKRTTTANAMPATTTTAAPKKATTTTAKAMPATTTVDACTAAANSITASSNCGSLDRGVTPKTVCSNTKCIGAVSTAYSTCKKAGNAIATAIYPALQMCNKSSCNYAIGNSQDICGNFDNANSSRVLNMCNIKGCTAALKAIVASKDCQQQGPGLLNGIQGNIDSCDTTKCVHYVQTVSVGCGNLDDPTLAQVCDNKACNGALNQMPTAAKLADCSNYSSSISSLSQTVSQCDPCVRSVVELGNTLGCSGGDTMTWTSQQLCSKTCATQVARVVKECPSSYTVPSSNYYAKMAPAIVKGIVSGAASCTTTTKATTTKATTTQKTTTVKTTTSAPTTTAKTTTTKKKLRRLEDEATQFV